MNYNNEKFIKEFKNVMLKIKAQKVLFVCSGEYDRYGYREALDEIRIKSVAFTSFEPCPEVSSVQKGIEAFKSNACDFVVAVGGGSAIDTAKGIKYYSKLDFKILAVPTTAGTGAEVTRFSVLYNNKDKASVSDWDIIPDYQIFDYTTLKTSVYKGYKRDKIEMRVDRVEVSDFPLYLNTVAGGLDRRDQTIGGFSFVVKIYAVPVVEIIG